MNEFTVACVLRSGGDFTPHHVAGLRDQVAHFMPEARFVCLSDVLVPCDRLPLVSTLPGWWAKLELFQAFSRALYLDLDTVLVARPDALIGAGKFCMIGDWIQGRLISSCMYWEGDYSRLYRNIDQRKMRRYSNFKDKRHWGDQGYIQDEIGGLVTPFPAGVVRSYKKHCKERIPEGTQVVAFHGQPRPWSVDVPEHFRKWWKK